MAFDAAGTLYVLDNNRLELLTVDKATGSVMTTVAVSGPLGVTTGMDFHPTTGVLYVADGEAGGGDSLYTLDPATGVMSLVGPLGVPDGFAGLTFFDLSAILIFADDFESGDTSAWSSTVPDGCH